MPNNKQSEKFSKYFNLPNPGLRAYFELVRNGQPDEYRTVFYRDKSVEDVLSGWDRILKPISKEWPSLYEFENDLRSKVGPMSVMRPLSERLPDIDSYYDSILLESEPIHEDALVAVRNEFGEGMVRLRPVQDTVNLMKKSTNSGSPYFTKRRDVTDKTLPFEITPYAYDERSNCIGWNIEYPRGFYDATAVLGWRGQEGGPNKEDVKQRVVWMFPYAVNIAELQLYQPLIEYCQRENLVPAWVSMDAVDERITKLFDTKGSNDVIVCTDFSKFDQHFNPSLQAAASYLINWICGANRDQKIKYWLSDVFPIKYAIPLAYDWNKVRTGIHGMASGSGGTNADETLVHRALQWEAARRNGKVLNLNSMCLGDDGILTYPGITVKDVMQTYTAHGLEMNQEKQYVSKQDCIYLRRWHHKDYRPNGRCAGVYSTFRALGRLCEQERWYKGWSNKMVALRQLSIIQNCEYHPLRERFADYCIKGDKYRLGLDIPGFLDDIDKVASEAVEQMPDFLGYTKSMNKDANTSLADWWIVKYLKSK